MSGISSRRDGPGRLEILGPGDTLVASLGPNEWESRFFATIRPVPIITDHYFLCMRRMF